MTRKRVVDLAAFATLFVAAALVGRIALVDDRHLALVWPASGVAVAWLAVTGWHRWLVADAATLFGCAAAVYLFTGVQASLAVGFAVGTVVQVLVLGTLLSQWVPAMWGFGDDPPPGVQGVRDLGYLMAAVFLSAAVASLAGPSTIVFVADGSWVSLTSWVVRSCVGVLAIFPLSLLVRNTIRSSPRGPVVLGRGGVIESIALTVTTAVALWLVFFVNDALPVPFLMLATCVWAGTRFSSWVSDIHAIALAAGVTVATALDHGPFTTIDDVGVRILVVQAYLAVVVALNLTLSVARRELLLVNRRLAESESASKEQAVLLRTIVDTMADGVSVLDANGRLVLRNEAASLLVGDPRLDAEGRFVSGDSIIRYTDGTPTSDRDDLFERALSGEPVEGVDLFVRTPTSDGRILEVTARPLPDTDPPLVVAVFHDVTSDRRERDELASFAGVVAHDLLNPLTVVEGWSEAMLEAARGGTVVPPDRQAAQLERIARAAQRMQHLISDLLAYTTSRDLKINPVPVDLAAMVADIARARTDAARVGGGVSPTIRIDPGLPSVLAEPVLLRQAIDNLVGNAIKYVAPGVVPQVCVSGAVVADGARPMVRIEVSDNGIGIPVEQQERVFDTFHRAHADGGYRGTGLGLSIVKRIAERHRGNAWAATNPATGGTTMTVTFPAALG